MMISTAELTSINLQDVQIFLECPESVLYKVTADGNPEIVKIFKKFNPDDIEYQRIQNSISTIESLSEHASLPAGYIVPSAIFTEKGKIRGYSMPFVEGVQFGKFEISRKTVTDIFAQLYKDVVFINRKTPFSLCDLHEDNIVIGPDGTICHIDSDGWYNGDGNYRGSRYLFLNRGPLSSFPGKYFFSEDGLIIPDPNSDLFCLNQMLLNCLLFAAPRSDRILEKEEMETYLNYLGNECRCPNVAAMIKCGYSESDNYFDSRVLNELPEDMEILSYKEFGKFRSSFKTEEDAMDFLNQKERELGHMFPERKEMIFKAFPD